MFDTLEYEFTWPDGHKELAEEDGTIDVVALIASGADLTGIYLNGVLLAPKEKTAS